MPACRASRGRNGVKFLEHDVWVTSALVQLGGGVGMWDEEDGFFYDVLKLPDGHAERLKVRSMVGLLPLCAATPFEPDLSRNIPKSPRGSNGSWKPARNARCPIGPAAPAHC